MTLYYTHVDCLEHETPRGHPESADRLRSLNEHLNSCGLLDEVDVRLPELALFEDIARVHSDTLVRLLRDSQPQTGLVRIDADTSFSRGSLDAARRCAGAVKDALASVLDMEHKTAFCGVRPPGHHAESNGSMGFCIFNSIAIGAELALDRVDRIAILDFDAHHGNGTVEIFQNKPEVLVCSTFQYPFYPYRYQNVDRPNIVNAPLPSGSDGLAFRKAIDEKWAPALERHKPDLLLVSAGFDAHRDDPLTGLNLTDEDYGWITARISDWSGEFSQGRVVSVLEGGYDLEALSRCGEIHLGGLLR